MSDSQNKFVRYLTRFGAGSMAISIIIHVFILGGATVFVVSSIQPQPKAKFQGGGSSGAPDVSHPVKMSNTQPNLEAFNQRLTVDSATADIALPDLPSLGETGPSSLSTGGGMGGGAGDGLGAGSGIGSLKAPLMPAFGFREAQAGGSLTGTLYLFPKSKFKDNDAESAFFKDWISKFKASGWSESYLQSLRKSPLTLYSTQITIPSIRALDAPKAFGVPDSDSKVRFLIRYEAEILPPHSGKWRFLAYGDDVMIVKIDGKVVLEASDPWQKLNKPGLSGWTPKTAAKYSSRSEDIYIVGDWMNLNPSWPTKIEIFMSEEPSQGNTSAVLLIEEEGANYQKTPAGLPILPIWSLAPNPTVPREKLKTPVATETPVWRSR